MSWVAVPARALFWIIIELAYDIAGRPPDDRGRAPETFEILPMADRALQCLACPPPVPTKAAPFAMLPTGA